MKADGQASGIRTQLVPEITNTIHIRILTIDEGLQLHRQFLAQLVSIEHMPGDVHGWNPIDESRGPATEHLFRLAVSNRIKLFEISTSSCGEWLSGAFPSALWNQCSIFQLHLKIQGPIPWNRSEAILIHANEPSPFTLLEHHLDLVRLPSGRSHDESEWDRLFAGGWPISPMSLETRLATEINHSQIQCRRDSMGVRQTFIEHGLQCQFIHGAGDGSDVVSKEQLGDGIELSRDRPSLLQIPLLNRQRTIDPGP